MRGGRSRLRNNAMTRATSPTRNGIFTRSFKAFLSTFSSVSVMVTVRTGPASYSFSLVVCAIFAFANPCFTEGNRNSRLWAVFGTLAKGLSYRSLNYRTGYLAGCECLQSTIRGNPVALLHRRDYSQCTFTTARKFPSLPQIQKTVSIASTWCSAIAQVFTEVQARPLEFHCTTGGVWAVCLDQVSRSDLDTLT